MSGQTAFRKRNLNGCARRLRRTDEVAPDMMTMQIVVCEECGVRFGIGHFYTSQDEALALLQAKWLLEHFTWDHIRGSKHHQSIPLPAACDIEDAGSPGKERRS